MIPSHFIAKHLDIKKGYHSGKCAFCGHTTDSAFIKKEILSSKFNDHKFFKYKTEHICEFCAACLSGNALDGKAIRNYSLIVTPDNLIKADKCQLIDFIQNPTSDSFLILVTYAGKKHAFFNSVVNTDKLNLTIGTDKSKVAFNILDFKVIITYANQLYENGFSKAEILSLESSKFNQIEKFGEDRYFNCLKFLRKYYDTPLFELAVYLLNKGKDDQND